VDVLSDAFANYPVMRYVIGAQTPDYGERLRAMISFFVMSRAYRCEEMLGISDSRGLCGAALVSRPDRWPGPEALDLLRTELWSRLGGDARERYDVYTAACKQFSMEAPHMHVNVIGVCERVRGTGLGRRLMDHIHMMSRGDANSRGVTLTTEEAGNVPFYKHLGYRLVGHARVAEDLETWGFFREN